MTYTKEEWKEKEIQRLSKRKKILNSLCEYLKKEKVFHENKNFREYKYL